MARPVLAWLPIALAALAFLGSVAGFFATWYSVHGSTGAVGDIDERYHLSSATFSAVGQTDTSRYKNDSSGGNGGRNDFSAGLQQTFANQAVVVWVATAVSLVALVVAVLPFYLTTAAWLRPALLVALAATAGVSVIGAALFAHNIPLTGEMNDVPGSGFWGTDSGFTRGPGFAWYAEAGAALLSIAALAVAALPDRR